MATKTFIFRGDTGKAYTVDVESLDGQTSIQTGIETMEIGTGTYTSSITSTVASTLTTYVTKINLGGSLVAYFGADLKEVAGTYYAQEMPTALMNAQIGGRGTGANAVTITVQDGSSVAIQNATVSAWSGSTLAGTSTTNASGVTSPALSLDNGTYTINITAGGFNGSSSSLVVNGATTPSPYTLTALTITPSDPPFVTGYLVTRVAGVATAGIEVAVAMTSPATGETGSAYLGQPITITSDGNGLVEFTNLSAGAKYSIRMEIDGQDWTGEFTAGSVTFEIPSFVG